MNSGDQHDDAPAWGCDSDDEPEVDQVHQDDHEHLPRQPESDGETTPEQEAYTVRTTWGSCGGETILTTNTTATENTVMTVTIDSPGSLKGIAIPGKCNPET